MSCRATPWARSSRLTSAATTAPPTTTESYRGRTPAETEATAYRDKTGPSPIQGPLYPGSFRRAVPLSFVAGHEWDELVVSRQGAPNPEGYLTFLPENVVLETEMLRLGR